MGELGEVGTSYSGIGSERGIYGRVSSGQLAVKGVRQTVGRDPPVSCTKYQPAEPRNAAHALPRNPAAGRNFIYPSASLSRSSTTHAAYLPIRNRRTCCTTTSSDSPSCLLLRSRTTEQPSPHGCTNRTLAAHRVRRRRESGKGTLRILRYSRCPTRKQKSKGNPSLPLSVKLHPAVV
jgi:hypothetical protein